MDKSWFPGACVPCWYKQPLLSLFFHKSFKLCFTAIQKEAGSVKRFCWADDDFRSQSVSLSAIYSIHPLFYPSNHLPIHHSSHPSIHTYIVIAWGYFSQSILISVVLSVDYYIFIIKSTAS
jgi:hypothetical protein